MINKRIYVESDSYNPYINLSVEEHLLLHVQPGEIFFYLWQNRNTVVIGRNQNVRKECKLDALKEYGGHLARRLSGGGAVYHDLGNLNFTFVMNDSDFDIDKQLGVIVLALRHLGIEAEKTGRNDIQVAGRKISGNAFYKTGESRYHHGTIMVNVDTEVLANFLNVSELKLRSKGVASVRSRVANLTDFRLLDISELKEALRAAFTEVYGEIDEELYFREADIIGGESACDNSADGDYGRVKSVHGSSAGGEHVGDNSVSGTCSAAGQPVQEDAVQSAEADACSKIAERAQFIASDEWLLGEEAPCTHEVEAMMPWGLTSIEMNVRGGRVRSAKVYTDALEVDMPARIEAAITGMWHEDVINIINDEEYDSLMAGDIPVINGRTDG